MVVSSLVDQSKFNLEMRTILKQKKFNFPKVNTKNIEFCKYVMVKIDFPKTGA